MRMSASVSASSETARRPRAGPIMNSYFSSSSRRVWKMDMLSPVWESRSYRQDAKVAKNCPKGYLFSWRSSRLGGSFSKTVYHAHDSVLHTHDVEIEEQA